jgi:hypothetical protein
MEKRGHESARPLRSGAPADCDLDLREKSGHARHLPALRKSQSLQQIAIGAAKDLQEHSGQESPCHPVGRDQKGSHPRNITGLRDAARVLAEVY